MCVTYGAWPRIFVGFARSKQALLVVGQRLYGPGAAGERLLETGHVLVRIDAGRRDVARFPTRRPLKVERLQQLAGVAIQRQHQLDRSV